MLKVELGNKRDLEWAQEVVEGSHYLHQRVDNRARPMVYILRYGISLKVGLVMVGIPHATRCRGWWGYAGLPTQWQAVDMSRIWVHPALQRGGELCRPGIVPGFTDRRGEFRSTLISEFLIPQVLERVQRDRVALWPPVFPEQPYHIRLVISYHDPRYHRGIIYRESGAIPMYTDEKGTPIPGSSDKYGWCWRLPEPDWEWWELENIRPRNMRLPL